MEFDQNSLSGDAVHVAVCEQEREHSKVRWNTQKYTVLTPWHSTCESSILSLALQWPLLPSSRLIVVGPIQTGVIKPTLTENCWLLTVRGWSWVYTHLNPCWNWCCCMSLGA